MEFSLEFFPPKTAEAQAQLGETVSQLTHALGPRYGSIT